MSLSIYQIDEAIMDCLNEDGEVIDVERMNELQMEREQKIENVGLWIKNLTAEAEAIKAEEAALDKRRKASEAKAESLKRYLQNALNGQKYNSARLSVSYRKSKAVHIIDPEKVPASYYEAKYEVSKTAIRNAILEGQKVSGAELVENVSMVIK